VTLFIANIANIAKSANIERHYRLTSGNAGKPECWQCGNVGNA
jgi:hypothetical protein